ncbi:hypothetical protein LTR07_005818, partial [Exophiala xenobiotica]
GSKKASDKRKRNAEASARWRAGRKEKREETSQTISRKSRKRHRNCANFIEPNETTITAYPSPNQFPQKPVSPRHRRRSTPKPLTIDPALKISTVIISRTSQWKTVKSRDFVLKILNLLKTWEGGTSSVENMRDSRVYFEKL